MGYFLHCNMPFSPGNSLLRKKQGKAAYNTPKWWDPFPEPAYAGALVHLAALYAFLCN